MDGLINGRRELSPDAVSVTVLPDYMLRIRYINGELRDFDMKPLLNRKYYAELKNELLFRSARVEYGTVQWANGADIDPEWLYEDSMPVNILGKEK